MNYLNAKFKLGFDRPDGKVYAIESHESDEDYMITWEDEKKGKRQTPYSKASVHQYIEQNKWILVEGFSCAECDSFSGIDYLCPDCRRNDTK